MSGPVSGLVSGGSRWWWRAGLGVLVFAAVEGVLWLIDGQADELRLALAVGLLVAAAALALDASQVAPAVWLTRPERESGLSRLDPRTSSYVRVIEGHLASRETDAALRARLRDLAEQTLRVRHGLSVTDAAAAPLLGAELHEVVTGPPRRLRLGAVERCVRRIEEL